MICRHIPEADILCPIMTTIFETPEIAEYMLECYLMCPDPNLYSDQELDFVVTDKLKRERGEDRILEQNYYDMAIRGWYYATEKYKKEYAKRLEEMPHLKSGYKIAEIEFKFVKDFDIDKLKEKIVNLKNGK